MTTILVTGSKGQLGSELRELAPGFPGFRFLFTDIEELDITDSGQVANLFAIEKPGVVINCAAYTAVDKAEDEEEKAFLLNGIAPGILASASAAAGGFFVQISTDYVFNGNSIRPILEEDKPDPQSAYGRTKLEGEHRVAAEAGHGVIIRTSWLYSSYGQNFVKTILKYGRERGELNVVSDQRGTPTYARDLAAAILEVVRLRDLITGVGIFNYSNEGDTTWYEFAVNLLAMKGVRCCVIPVTTGEYPTRAARPSYSVLSREKIRSVFGLSIPGWKESLKECLLKID